MCGDSGRERSDAAKAEVFAADCVRRSLDLHSHPQLDGAVAWDVEVIGNASGTAGHRCEESIAPPAIRAPLTRGRTLDLDWK